MIYNSQFIKKKKSDIFHPSEQVFSYSMTRTSYLLMR